MNKEEFLKETQKLKINITFNMLNQLEKYYDLLVNENKKYNLTTITQKEEVYLKHFFDSLTIIKAIKLDHQSLLDIGSGAGLPGIVLKIVFPDLKVTLLDATSKKCLFLKKVICTLNLSNISVINARAEEYAKIHREEYDITTSRAVAPLKHLLEYSIPTLKVGGIFISLKGNIENELTNINNYYQKLNLSQEKIISFNLPNNTGHRTIYTTKKNSPTPLIYPRTYSKIKNQPL